MVKRGVGNRARAKTAKTGKAAFKARPKSAGSRLSKAVRKPSRSIKSAKPGISIPKAQAKASHLFQNVPMEFNFWVSDGRVVRNVSELYEASKTMTDEIYVLHANHMKNDFADWIRDIVNDENLAYSARKANNRKEFEHVLGKSLKGKTADIKEQTKLPTLSLVPKELPKIMDLPSLPEFNEMKISRIEVKPMEEPKTMPNPNVSLINLKKIPEPKQKFESPKPEIRMPDKENKSGAKKMLEEGIDPRISALRRREESLIIKEKSLNEEEQKLNQAKIDLTRRRYELLKERGAMEKEKFELFLSKKSPQFSGRMLELPHISTTQLSSATRQIDFSAEKIESMIKDARVMAEEGKATDATRRFVDIETQFNSSPLPPEEKRRLKFQIMELETDIRLATIKH